MRHLRMTNTWIRWLIFKQDYRKQGINHRKVFIVNAMIDGLFIDDSVPDDS